MCVVIPGVRICVGTGRPRRETKGKGAGSRAPSTASDTVLEIIGRYQNGIGFAHIKLQSGYGDKKLRNILFRLNKAGKIKRKQRGIYQQS